MDKELIKVFRKHKNGFVHLSVDLHGGAFKLELVLTDAEALSVAGALTDVGSHKDSLAFVEVSPNASGH